MSKKISTIILILMTLLIYILQRNVFSAFKIAGIAPNIFIIYILFLGLYTNQAVSISAGIFIGILLDSAYGKCIGISPCMFCLVAYLASYFDKNFSKDNKLTILLMVVGATIIYETGWYFISSVILKFDIEMLYFIRNILLETLYNVLLFIIIYPLFQKTGYILDRKYKKTNLLTRYF